MEDLSNTTVVTTFVSLLLGAISIVWGLYKTSESNARKDRVAYTERLLKASQEKVIQMENHYASASKVQEESHDKHRMYLEGTVSDYKKDLDELQAKYYELGSTIQPALETTNRTLSDLGVIIQRLIANGK